MYLFTPQFQITIPEQCDFSALNALCDIEICKDKFGLSKRFLQLAKCFQRDIGTFAVQKYVREEDVGSDSTEIAAFLDAYPSLWLTPIQLLRAVRHLIDVHAGGQESLLTTYILGRNLFPVMIDGEVYQAHVGYWCDGSLDTQKWHILFTQKTGHGLLKNCPLFAL